LHTLTNLQQLCLNRTSKLGNTTLLSVKYEIKVINGKEWNKNEFSLQINHNRPRIKTKRAFILKLRRINPQEEHQL
jgi:hypothetical protein